MTGGYQTTTDGICQHNPQAGSLRTASDGILVAAPDSSREIRSLLILPPLDHLQRQVLGLIDSSIIRRHDKLPVAFHVVLNEISGFR